MGALAAERHGATDLPRGANAYAALGVPTQGQPQTQARDYRIGPLDTVSAATWRVTPDGTVGEFTVGGRRHGPGTMFFHGDPHCEEELHTETGGMMLIVQYPGPTTGGRPIYDDRFNMEQRRQVAQERVDL